jgi:hypothetical protein
MIGTEDQPGGDADHFRREADHDRDEAEGEDVARAERNVAVRDDEDQRRQQREDRIGIVADAEQRADIEDRDEQQRRDHHGEQRRCGGCRPPECDRVRGVSLQGT